MKRPSDPRAHTVSVLLSEDEFARFTRYCEARGFKKSTLVARLIREYLDTERFELAEPGNRGRRKEE